MSRFQKVIWSLVEERWLRENKDLPINHLCGELSKSRNAVKKKLAELFGNGGAEKKKVKGRSIPKTKIGKRVDCDNNLLRSAWEANSYRYIKTLSGVDFIEVEPTTFSFAPFGVLKGTVSYTPDFKVHFKNGDYIWIEVKGYIDRQGKTKIRRFKKFYPEEAAKLHCIVGSEKTSSAKFFVEEQIPAFFYYNEVKKEHSKSIPNWE
jgi:hypothetical protein